MAFALMRWYLGIVQPYSGIHKYQSALMEELKLKYQKRDFSHFAQRNRRRMAIDE